MDGFYSTKLTMQVDNNGRGTYHRGEADGTGFTRDPDPDGVGTLRGDLSKEHDFAGRISPRL